MKFTKVIKADREQSWILNGIIPNINELLEQIRKNVYDKYDSLDASKKQIINEKLQNVQEACNSVIAELY